jgi:hypothetical protein
MTLEHPQKVTMTMQDERASDGHRPNTYMFLIHGKGVYILLVLMFLISH